MWDFDKQDILAHKAWPILIRHARKGQKLFYSELSFEMDVDVRQLRYLLEVIQIYCRVHQLPHLTALVIQKSTGLPGPGCNIAHSDLTDEYRMIQNHPWSEAPKTFITNELISKHQGEVLSRPLPTLSRTPYSIEGIWLLRVDPERWDIEAYLQDGHEFESFLLTNYKTHVAMGDPFILWLGGAEEGAIGWGKFTGLADQHDEYLLNMYWKAKTPVNSVYFKTRLSEWFPETPISYELLKKDSRFETSIFEYTADENPLPISKNIWKAFREIIWSRENKYFDQRETLSQDKVAAPIQIPAGHLVPMKQSSSNIMRVIRDTRVTRWVKDLYSCQCQVCGITLRTNFGPYAEGAHIKPLGGEHAGPDVPDNVLSLCPNCHTLFDNGNYFIDSRTFLVRSTVTKEWTSPLIRLVAHTISPEYLDYHREHVARYQE